MSSGTDQTKIADSDYIITGVVGTVDIYTASPQRVGYLSVHSGTEPIMTPIITPADCAVFDAIIAPVLNNVFIPLSFTWEKGIRLVFTSPNNNLFAFVFLDTVISRQP